MKDYRKDQPAVFYPEQFLEYHKMRGTAYREELRHPLHGAEDQIFYHASYYIKTDGEINI